MIMRLVAPDIVTVLRAGRALHEKQCRNQLTCEITRGIRSGRAYVISVSRSATQPVQYVMSIRLAALAFVANQEVWVKHKTTA